MNEQENNFMEQIKELVFDDYVNPGIRTEVIFDCLLTPYIAEIVKEQLSDKGDAVSKLVLLAKEMSISDGRGNDMGFKVDYVLADEECIYLVELKTTESSFNPDQAEVYRKFCQGKKFGEVLGCQLLSILSRGSNTTFTLNLGEKSKWNDQTLETAFNQVIKKYISDATGESCKEKAKHLILAQGWTQKKTSRKYLYTLGRLVDYLNDGKMLWDKPMEVLYLTPEGKDISIGEKIVFRGISLIKAKEYLVKRDDEFAKLLSIFEKMKQGMG